MATPSYTPDNTRSSVIVILFIAAAVALVAMLIGLSEKPEVEAIGVVAERVPAADAAEGDGGASAVTPGFDSSDGASAGTTQGDPSLGDDAAAAGSIDATAIPIPTSTPEPTAEIAAAVEPTALPEQSTEGGIGGAAAAPFTPGTITGAFFTRPDEDEGATVQRNELSLTLNADGTGSFTGALDMTMPDATQITLAMSGPIRWTTAQPPTPQVEATLMGSYTFDSQIDLDDVTATDAELTISSLGSGSGSLCFPRCFGFTFTPQTGF